MRLAIGIACFWDTLKIVEYAKMTESYGMKEFWLEDNPFGRNPHMILSIISTVTKKVRLGMTTPLDIRPPAVIARDLMNLDEIAPGRAAVAIGLGTEKSTEIIRNAVKTVKNVINGKEINFYGRNVNVRKLKIGWPPIRRIPVYAAVNGPKSCEAVADVADGIHFALMPVGYVDHIIKMLKKIRGDLKGFEFLNHIVTFISEDYDDAEKRARGYVRPHALHIPLVLEKAGFKEEEIEVLRRWPAGKTEEIINNLMTLSTKVPKGIPENVIEKLMAEFSIYGTPDDVVKRLKEYEQKGLDMMSITLFGPDITRDIKLIAEKVFPEFE